MLSKTSCALCLLLFSLIFCQADVIKVGAVLPLSGEYDFVGSAMREGMQLSLKDFGPTKHQYQLVFEDSAFVASKSALAAQKLITIDKVDVVTTAWGPEAAVVGPITERAKVVHVANDWDLLWTQKYKYSLNVSNPCDEYAQLQLQMIHHWGAHRIAFIYQNSADWVYALSYFYDAVKSDPALTLVAKESFNSPVRDFRTMLAKINETHPDLIVVWSILPESEIILREIRELGIKARVTGFFEDISDKSIGNGTSFIRFDNPQDAFQQRYLKENKKEMPYALNAGYDQMSAILRLCEKFDKKPTSEEIVNAEKSLHPWLGASGLMRPRPDRIIAGPFKILKFENGQAIPDPEFADVNKKLDGE